MQSHFKKNAGCVYIADDVSQRVCMWIYACVYACVYV